MRYLPAGVLIFCLAALPVESFTASSAETVDWPHIVSAANLNIDARVARLLARMSLAEKVGQMVMGEISSVSPADVRDYHLGAVLNGGGSWPGGNKLSTIADWVALADRYYLASTDTRGDRAGIPVMWGTDAVHGHNNVVGATLFPHNIGLGMTGNPELVRRIGAATALQVAATGIDWVFGPAVAVVRNDRWGRTYEGYAEDPEIVRAYAGEMVAGLQGEAGTDNLFGPEHVLATAKHFIADGGTLNGEDQGNFIGTERQLRDIHAQGYLAALDAGVQTVMATFNSWNGIRVHGSEYLLTDVLKHKLGFDGFVLGDWNGHGQVPGCRYSQCAQAILAGIDMLMVPYEWKAFIVNTIRQVETGVIPLARIDDAVTRILRVKARTGILDKPQPSRRRHAGDASLPASTAQRALARQAVRESLVLLKNRQQLLPLDPSLHILVAGRGADDIAMQCGGWTVSWQGAGNTNADFPRATSILAGIRRTVTAAGGRISHAADGSFDASSPPDVAIVVYGESPYAEYLGDLQTLDYQSTDNTDLELLKHLRKQGIPVVSVFLSGRPLWVNPELNASNAFVAAWLPGSEGGGIADVLFRSARGDIQYDFTGRLSYSWPRRADQDALNRYDESYDPLFAYGYGLTYSDIDTPGSKLDETGALPAAEYIMLPGAIEAENYTDMYGLEIVAGDRINGANPGDWLEYSVDIGATGIYRLQYRVASATGSRGFEVLLNGVKIDQQDIAATGNGDAWTTNTAKTSVNLPAGRQTLRINSIGSGWQLDWLRLDL